MGILILCEFIMFRCKYCLFYSNDSSNLKRHVETKQKGFRQKCADCDYTFRHLDNLKRHMNKEHNSVKSDFTHSVKTGFQPYQEPCQDLQGVLDIRLKENFKLFVSGPSRCRKTLFCYKTS